MQQLTRQLRRWQAREWGYRLVGAFARWFAVGLAALTLCCFTDWLIDRYTDTPMWLRVTLSVGQVVLLVVAARYLFRLHVPSLDALAGQAEEAYPEFDHRLVTALQLNRPGARTAGMSPQLIHAVTTEADALAARHDLRSLVKSDRLASAAILLFAVGLVPAVFAIARPTLTGVLLQRQLLHDIDIPRSISLVNQTKPLWPGGDEVTIAYAAEGAVTDDHVGTVIVEPDGQPAMTVPLTFDRKNGDGAIFTAILPASSTPFHFRARLRDGRTRTPSRVEFVPRPVVKDINAWLVLPSYVDPEGKRRYERYQPQGEVTALPECGLRVEIGSTKPVASAVVVVYARTEAGVETVAARVPMAMSEDRLSAGASFDIPPRPSAYRIEVTDDNGFANANPPRRGIGTVPDDPPRVNLLTEVLKDPKEPGPLDDFEVTGMPLVLGGQVQIGYAARSPLGLSKAFIHYRVNDDENWTPLPLTRTVADAGKLGAFVPELGVFENSGPFGQVEFYQIPSADLETDPPGLEAGGRYNFQTAALTKRRADGTMTKLEVNDRVEFCVAVHDRNPAPVRIPGKSESRMKSVVTQAQLDDWTRARDQSRERLKTIEDRQRGVFKPTKP